MNFFMDEEFDENGVTIVLISIGIVCDNGKELYLVSNEFNPDKCNDWVKKNVLPLLPPKDSGLWKSRAEIRDAIAAFVTENLATLKDHPWPHTLRESDYKASFWGYYSDYDWVCFAQLWGKMIDLPKGFPMYCLDLKQWAWQLGQNKWMSEPKLPKQEGAEHSAIEDARWNKKVWEFLNKEEFRLWTSIATPRDSIDF